jgi:hypothetical protein
MNPEAYEWGGEKVNALEPLSYPSWVRIASTLSGTEISALGYSNEEELIDMINQQFMISE